MNEAEAAVVTHHQLMEAVEQFKDWMETHTEKLQSCIEPAADKHGLEIQRERVQVGSFC